MVAGTMGEYDEMFKGKEGGYLIESMTVVKLFVVVEVSDLYAVWATLWMLKIRLGRFYIGMGDVAGMIVSRVRMMI